MLNCETSQTTVKPHNPAFVCLFTNRNRHLIVNFSIMRNFRFFRFLRQLGNLLLQVALVAQELSRMLALSLGLRLALGQLFGAAL